jgi:5-formyltetrahydrofolate cyclo-ligase
MFKVELRKIYLAKQKSLSAFGRKQKSEQIIERFFAGFDLRKINFLHCFLPIERTNEIETKPIFQKIWREFHHIETLVPRVNFQEGEIESLKLAPETKLVKNTWEISEPTHDEIVEAEKIDLVLVPLLCFDRRGFRIGYGKGFYDKLLKNCRADCLKIGLSYFEAIAEIADVQEFDVRLDFCVTPEEIVNCKK